MKIDLGMVAFFVSLVLGSAAILSLPFIDADTARALIAW